MFKTTLYSLSLKEIMNMRAEVLGEFTDDEKWLRFFSKKNLLVMLPGLFLTWVLNKFFTLFGFGIFGLIVGLVFTVITTGFTMIPVFDMDNKMIGTGQTLDMLLIRKWIHKKNACIYIKGYDS